jgi:hypothetical protein
MWVCFRPFTKKFRSIQELIPRATTNSDHLPTIFYLGETILLLIIYWFELLEDYHAKKQHTMSELFSLYLQSRTQSTPFKMNNNAINNKKDDEQQLSSQQLQNQVDGDCWGEPQYFSNTVSVLPADRYGSYHIIYHRNASGECRDDFDENWTTSSSTSTNDTRREYDVGRQDYLEANLVANHSMMETKPESIMYDKNAGSTTPRSVQGRSSPPAFTMLDDDEDYDDDDAGFVSLFAEGACVACFIPVLHFIQFFMC